MDGPLLLTELTGPQLTPEEAAMFRRLQPAGFVLTERNIVSPEQTHRLTDDLRDLSTDLPVIAICEPGGTSGQLGKIATPAPSAAMLAARADYGIIADAGALTGDLLRMLGINLNLAPVLEIGRFSEPCHAWSGDPQRVIDYAGHWNRWMRKRCVASCAGHFPARGQSAATLDDLLRGDAIPYTALMPELDAILISHARFPNIDSDFPAAFSQRVVRRFLRDQLGFDRHLVLTEVADAEQARLAIAAGNDLAIIPRGIEEAAAKAIAGLPHHTRDEAMQRVEKFRRKKLHGPLLWSEKKWSTTCDALTALAAGFQEPGEL